MQAVPESHPRSETAERLILTHYEDFNARRLTAASARFHDDARIENITGQVQHGPQGFVVLAEEWITAFPDGRLLCQSIVPRSAGLYDAELIADGTHTGTLTLASWAFRPTNVHVRIPARQLFQVEDGRFRLTSLSFDLQDLVRQLAGVDTRKLLEHLTRIHQLGESLARESNPTKQRELIDRIGRDLDAARHVVRPYFKSNQ